MTLPAGIITMWEGAIGDIPSGFVLCDGNNGTPDLRDKFVAGAGNFWNPGDTGGATTHDHDFTGDGHTHTHDVDIFLGAGGDFNKVTASSPAAGTTDPASSLPKYYALAFIMKT